MIAQFLIQASYAGIYRREETALARGTVRSNQKLHILSRNARILYYYLPEQYSLLQIQDSTENKSLHATMHADVVLFQIKKAFLPFSCITIYSLFGSVFWTSFA
ncbi:hypothetical protein ACJX0J_035754 [Zea mays]